MSTRTLNGTPSLGKSRQFLARVALSGCVALSIAAPSLWAAAPEVLNNLTPAQAAVEAAVVAIVPTKNILTASAADIALAVSNAITSNTDVSITPAELAAAPFLATSVSVGAKTSTQVRADRNTSSATVVDAAIAALSGTSAGFDANVASIVDTVVDVNGTNGALASKEVLSTAGQTAVVKAALGTISDEASPLVDPTALLAADQSIGQALEGDAYLGGLAKGALSAILDGGIAGINGVKGKSTGVAPEAAQDFVAGIVDGGTLPNVAGTPTASAYNTFAVAILKSVSKNTSVDELVANSIAAEDSANVVSLAGSLFAKYAAAQAKITQGIAATIAVTGTDDAARGTFFANLTTAVPANAVNIAQGAVFVDPYQADSFTQNVFASVLATKGAKTLAADATAAATAIGKTLGQDGDDLTHVASVYMGFLTAGNLPAASAASYATNLINGAIAGLPATVPTAYYGSVGDGGQLNGGKATITTAITSATVQDLAGVVDLLATGIIGSPGLTSAKVAADIAALVKGVASITKAETFDSGTLVAIDLAGSLGTTVEGLLGNSNASEVTAIDASIVSALKGIVGSANVGTLQTDVGNGSFAQVGELTLAETTVTNL